MLFSGGSPRLNALSRCYPGGWLKTRACARGRLDRIEQESFDFFNRTRARYLELAAQDKSIHTIDATQPLEAVMDAIRTTVTNWVKELDA